MEVGVKVCITQDRVEVEGCRAEGEGKGKGDMLTCYCRVCYSV